MAEIKVTFTEDCDVSDSPFLPVVVTGIEDHLNADALEVTAGEAIDEALEIIHSAPGWDHIPVSEIDRAGVSASVEINGIER